MTNEWLWGSATQASTLIVAAKPVESNWRGENQLGHWSFATLALLLE
jgi:hypothetical protein